MWILSTSLQHMLFTHFEISPFNKLERLMAEEDINLKFFSYLRYCLVKMIEMRDYATRNSIIFKTKISPRMYVHVWFFPYHRWASYRNIECQLTIAGFPVDNPVLLDLYLCTFYSSTLYFLTIILCNLVLDTALSSYEYVNYHTFRKISWNNLSSKCTIIYMLHPFINNCVFNLSQVANRLPFLRLVNDS